MDVLVKACSGAQRGNLPRRPRLRMARPVTRDDKAGDGGVFLLVERTERGTLNVYIESFDAATVAVIQIGRGVSDSSRHLVNERELAALRAIIQ